MTRQRHWNTVYKDKTDLEVSWFEQEPTVSLDLLTSAGLKPSDCVIDVGGGNSRLVDALLDRRFRCLAVLDVAAAALARSQARLGTRAEAVTWIEADVTGDWTWGPADVWHDRAVFHFLTNPDDRAAYRQRMNAVLRPGGLALIATFAPDGPETCSGLPVARYSPETLAAELGPRLTPVASLAHTHTTPWGSSQAFQYSLFRRA